jgi:hypothetical protein
MAHHFFLSRFTFAFDFSACCIFFCRFGIFVAGFLGPCRSFFDMMESSWLNSTGQGEGSVE